VQGVAGVLEEQGWMLPGWEGVIGSDVPVGSGLSSSAALELAVARAFIELAGAGWDPVEMARAAQRAENEWVGMNCGIMDQMISAAGQDGHALLIDCRSLATTAVPFPPGVAVAVLDTGTRRGLVDSAYNERRSQCEAAAAAFQVPALRDVTLQQFRQQRDGLDEVTRRRARHVISENERTVQAADAMRRGNVDALGKLMDESHVSLRDDYEVSSDALDAMVEVARAHPACRGARMTGAGFGGCAVALIRADATASFCDTVLAAYTARINATNFAMANDDGTHTREYDRADVILIGVSRSGKTPTCLYLALQYGAYAANYPLVDDDLDSRQLPAVVAPYLDKLFGLTIEPERLHQIREERRPGSRYASIAQCEYEVRCAETLFERSRIPFLDATETSIEEIASRVIDRMGIERRLRP